MAGVLNKPDVLSLSGNMNQFLLSSTGLVSFILKKGNQTLLEQSYEPGPDLMVRIDLKDVIEGQLSYNLDAGSLLYVQPNLAETFTAVVDGAEYSFRVVRGGVADLADTAANWLKLHFLTWQPRVKQVTYYSPEWLTYYAVESCTIKLKATYSDKSIRVISLGTCSAGSATTVNLQYSVVAGKLGYTYPSYYEVWTEKSDGTKLSESQVYAFSYPVSEDEQWFLFENSLGGLDTFRATGTNNLAAEHEHNLAEFGGVREEYEVDTQRKYVKNTGYLDAYSRKWLLDFFPSKAKFIYEATAIRKIVVTDSNATYVSNELPSNYTFTWQLAEVSAYLNLLKNDSDIPDNLIAPDLSSPDFSIPPRLAEYPRVQLTEGVLLPAFDPFAPKPTVTSYGAIYSTIKNAVVKELEDEISKIGDGSGSGGGEGGGSNIEIIKLNDLTAPSDENVFSSLRTLYEIEHFANQLDDRYIRKDIDDVGYGFYTWEAGWMTKAPVRSAIYNLGWEEENPTGWYVSEGGIAWYSSMNVRGPILSNGVIGSPYYVSGWTGYGSQWDMVGHRLETDFISVRKELRVYALDVFRIYGTNGDLAVSTTNKIDRVVDMGSAWRCYIDTYDGEMYMNMRIDDVVKCQTWEKLSGRYYMARVTNIDEKWFDLSKTLLEGTTTPAAGDIVIRWSNLTNNDRKGLLYLSASDSYAPYMDVRFGDWDATIGTIKVRSGRLDGINDPLFPELYISHNNFGFYTSNFYGTGELILRSTGESVSRTFEVLKDSIKMGLDEVRYELQVSQGSVLVNPAFQEGISSWEVTNVYYPWTVNDNFLQINYKPFVNFVSGGIVVTDDVINRPVLQIADSTVIQRNTLFTTKTPGKYSLRFSYRSLLPFGFIEIGIPGSQIFIKVNLSENQTYQKAEIAGDWDGTGDFRIVVNGVVNISDISFIDDKLANAINEVKVYYDTKLTFYAEKAVMNSFREEYDEFNRVVKKDYATQTWTYNTINTEVGTIVNGKLTNYSTTTQTARMIENKVADLNLGQYATTSWTSNQIRNTVYDLNLGQYATQSWTSTKIDAVVTKVDSINKTISQSGWISESSAISLFAKKTDITGDKVIGYINVQPSSIKISAKNIELDGTTIASVIQANTISTSKLNVLSGAKIGGFSVTNNNLTWSQYNYFGQGSRTIRMGCATDQGGAIDITFDASTSGAFGIKSVGRAPGGAAIYASSMSSQTYPPSANTYAGYFDGAFYAMQYYTKQGSTYKRGISFSKGYDLDDVRIEVENGLVVGLYKDNGSVIVQGY
ncbi:hypothetical protein [Parabacteroides sp.]|jgi:hypothetical protein|uniref:hypothetical protein n=1 Tax=Parabacteroides sp. TaxID=1869337 RepID=UPI003080496C